MTTLYIFMLQKKINSIFSPFKPVLSNR
uniref:Uncharacterized protein n=1 Tax=Lepeophtheirus salmonis TaxID=72036 RepID=A0A0K2V984_LEPSM